MNEAIYQTERALLRDQGLPNRPWYKNQISAPGQYTGYGAKTLPGVREAAEASRWEEANTQAQSVAEVLKALTGRIRHAADQLSHL